MILINTINTQRSYNNSWAEDGYTASVPSGFIVDIGVTLDRKATVGISLELSDSGEVTALLVSDDYTAECRSVIGHVTTSTVGVPVAVDCIRGCTASIVFGYIPSRSELNQWGLPQVIPLSFMCVHVNTAPTASTLIFNVTRSSGVETYTIHDRTLVVTDNSLTLSRDAQEHGTAVLSISDHGIQSLLPSDDNKMLSDYVLTSINNVTSLSGLLQIRTTGVNALSTSATGSVYIFSDAAEFDADNVVGSILARSRSSDDGARASDVAFDEDDNYAPDGLPCFSENLTRDFSLYDTDLVVGGSDDSNINRLKV